MKDNIIKFLYPKETKILFEDVFPIKAVQNIPEWFKELNHEQKKKTIKGCLPFLDSLSAGYILRMPQDFYINHNYANGAIKDTSFRSAFGLHWSAVLDLNLNVNIDNSSSFHSIEQLGGKEGKCPFIKKNKNLPFYKIINPFRIETPPGYSCLFTSPFNNRDDRFEVISGIVDTDTFAGYINFPIIINGDKYPVLETTIERGTPYVQVIPFKRNNWRMHIKEDYRKKAISDLSVTSKLVYAYKKLFWSKKSWK